MGLTQAVWPSRANNPRHMRVLYETAETARLN
jgi:hypothetical protein